MTGWEEGLVSTVWITRRLFRSNILIRPVGLEEASNAGPSVRKERVWTGWGWEKLIISMSVRRLRMWIDPEWRPIATMSRAGDCARDVTALPNEVVSNISFLKLALKRRF